MDSDEITDLEKLHCAQRELMMRKRVYPRWVGAGRMTAAAAQHETAAMQAIVNDYENKVRPKLV